jgi:hypothetical protein
VNISTPVLVLDQNFPTNLLTRLPWPDVQLIALRDLHPDLIRDHDDWEVLYELRARGGVDGFITGDANMLKLEKEMCVLHQSNLALIVCDDDRSDPFISTGLLMIHLPVIVRQLRRGTPQMWVLGRPKTKPPERPWGRIQQFADARGIAAQHLFDVNKIQ